MAVTYNTTNQAFPNTVTSGGYTINNIGGAGSSTITLTGAGSGAYLTSSGTSATYTTAWAQPNTNFHDGTNTVMTIPNDGKKVILEKSATLEVQGNVVINGLDLEERLKTIERLLLIPERDVTMEAKYPSLKKKYDEYINTLEKYRTFERIKGED